MTGSLSEHGSRLRQRLREREALLGMFCVSYSVQNVEVLASSGLDFVIFDHEHGPWSWPDFHAQLAVLQAGEVAAIVRVAELTPVNARLLADLGVDGIMVANTDSVAQAEGLVECLRYPPRGRRGMGGSIRATDYGRQPMTQRQAERQCSLWVQLETRAGLRHAREIAAVDGVDAVFFGPHDLAVDMGHYGDPRHPEVRQALQDGVASMVALGRTTGILTAGNDLAAWRQAGVTLLACGSDLGLLAQATAGLVAQNPSLREPRR